MYGLSDQPNIMPRTRLSADLQGSSRYSARISHIIGNRCSCRAMLPMEEIEPGISRLTVQLPVRPGHVHCYVVEGDDGRLLIDTGLALPGLDELFRNELDGPVDRIVITHFHPDQSGAERSRGR